MQNIDFKLLAKQKAVLIELSNHFEQLSDFNKVEALDGIINLLDALGDEQKEDTPEQKKGLKY